MCGHRVCISCCLAASRDAGGAAGGAGVGLARAEWDGVTPTSR